MENKSEEAYEDVLSDLKQIIEKYVGTTTLGLTYAMMDY